MTGKDLKEWLETLDEEQLNGEVYGGAPDKLTGAYNAVEKMSVCRDTDGDKAIFLEPIPVEELEESVEDENNTEPSTEQ